MKARHVMLGGLLVISLAALPARAGLRYGSSAEAWALVGGQPMVHNFDPADQPLRWSSTGMSYASTSAFDSHSDGLGGLLASNAAASVGVHSGRVDGLLLSTLSVGADPVPEWAMSSAVAGGLIELDTVVLGLPGSGGRLSVLGSFSASVAAGVGSRSGASLSFSAGVQSFAPDQAGCLLATCRASSSFNLVLSDGQSLADPVMQAFALDIDVKAGDRLTLSFIAAARATGGYVLTLGDGQAVGDPAYASRMNVAAADAAGGFIGLHVSPGLELSPVAGLERRADGSYGFASTVPEPASLLLFAVGLLILLRRRHHVNR